jgi:hypothetical protein
MATAPVGAGPQGVKPRREMIDVKAPEQFSFNDQHRTLSGVLIDIDQVMVKPKDGSPAKPTMQYILQDEEKQRFTFLGTYDLTRKIQPSHIGHWMTITYEGEDATVQTQGSPLRKFRVQVSKDKEPGF